MQTADEYIKFCIKDSKWSGFKLFIIRVIRNGRLTRLLNRLFPFYKSPKPIILNMFGKGLSRGFLEHNAREFSKYLESEYEIDIIINEILEKKQKGYKVILVSGGYSIYLKEFRKGLFDEVIATEIELVNDVSSGRLKGLDCLGENKIEKVFSRINKELIDYENSYVYSDSITDLPLFSLAKNKVVISKNKPQHWPKINWKEYEERIIIY
ncbi:HAD-IB family phosphatase [Vibrio parahaemolyticus]|nr:HAD-IB family phosphatase [Vibrio parahaemolyticus]WMN68091.1 HAD-IB family phosphatase [Vibrio parahaemolyticus]